MKIVFGQTEDGRANRRGSQNSYLDCLLQTMVQLLKSQKTNSVNYKDKFEGNWFFNNFLL